MNYISKITSIQLKFRLQPAIIALLFITVFSIAQSSKNILPDWAFGEFVRSENIVLLDVPFLRPMEPFEKSGQYVNRTVFIKGMAFFKKKWYLYYGCADSRVGVAIYDPSVHAPPDPIILNTTP